MRKLLFSILFFLCCWSKTIAQTATDILVQDTRASGTTPSSYGRSFQVHFKNSNTVQLPAVGSGYSTVLGIRGWVDYTGGKAHEMAFSDNNQIYIRSGLNSSWEAWRKFITEDTSGYVGIGTNNPQGPLHIVNNNNIQSLLLTSSSAGWGSGMVFQNTAASGKSYGIYANAYGALSITDANAGQHRLFIQNNGNVGIGTGTPATKLHVVGGHISASSDEGLSNFVQLWDENAVIWKNGTGSSGLRFGSATDLNAGSWSEKMRITDAGRLGIGTETPYHRLHVKDDGIFQSKIESSSAFAGLLMKSGSTTKQLGFHFGSDPSGSGHATNDLRIGRYTLGADRSGSGWEANPVLLDLDAPDGSFALSEEGNIGIGTLYPGYKLDVITSNPNAGMRIMHNYSGFVSLSANSFGQGSYNPLTQTGDAGIVYGSTNMQNSFGFVITPWSNTLGGLRMDKDGNVGIATGDTKGYRFAVNGDAMFTKIKVKAAGAWPDYVFEKTYKLPSLKEVEEYIQAYKHLPGISSAKEIEENGLDVGENQAALLKKVEELTLYIIDMKKQIGNQQEEIIQLKQTLNNHTLK